MAAYGLFTNTAFSIPLSPFSLKILADKFSNKVSSDHFNFSSISHLVAPAAVSFVQYDFGTLANYHGLYFSGYALFMAAYGLFVNIAFSISPSPLS